MLERTDQPLAVDLPLMREIRAAVSKCLENGRDRKRPAASRPRGLSRARRRAGAVLGSFGMGSRDLQPEGLIAAVENMLPDGKQKKLFYLSIDFLRDKPITPKQEAYQQTIAGGLPERHGARASTAARTRT